MTKEIVIAAYDKSLDWIKEINPEIKVTVYRKGEVLPLAENEIKITPNKGRCVHTFFNHIYSNYDNLSDYTFFVQDYPFDHWGNLLHILNSDVSEIEKNASLTIGGYHGFHNNTLGTAWSMSPSLQFGDGVILTCFSNGYPQDLNPKIDVDKYWKLLFSDIHTLPSVYEFMSNRGFGDFMIDRKLKQIQNKEWYKQISIYEFIPGGHFVITKEQIRIRTKEYYKRIIDFLIEDENRPWMIERLECYIFNKNYKSK